MKHYGMMLLECVYYDNYVRRNMPRALDSNHLIIVTVSAKTDHVRTKTEIAFIAQEHSYTQELSMHSVSTVQCERVCFSGGHFSDPVMSWLREWRLWRAPIGPAMTWNCSHC